MATDTFKKEDLEGYYGTLFSDQAICHAVAISFQAALRKGKKASPKAPLKHLLENYLPRPLGEHLDNLGISQVEKSEAYQAVILTLDDLRKYVRSKNKRSKKIQVNSGIEKPASNRSDYEADPSIHVIRMDIANSLEKGLTMLLLNSLLGAQTPEELLAFLNQQLGTVGLSLSKQHGTYAFISTDKNGNHERYAGIARNQNKYVNNVSGYVSHEPNIGGRNAFEIFKMIHSAKGQFFEKRFGQFNRVTKISVLPMIQLSDEHFHNLVDIESYDEYMKLLESLTMGFVDGFGIQSDGAGLNIKHADDPQAFLAGLSISYPKTYRDLKLLEQNKVLASWTDQDLLNLFGLSKLYRTDEELGIHRDPMNPLTFNKSRAELALAKIKDADGLEVLDDNDPIIKQLVEPEKDWNYVLTRASRVQKRLKSKGSIESYNDSHGIGESSYHDLAGIGNRADRIKEAVSIFSDFPAIDLTWALSNASSPIKYKKIDLSERPVQDKENGETLSDFKERVKLYEDSINSEDAAEFEETSECYNPER